jgi:hypothetical protein
VTDDEFDVPKPAPVPPHDRAWRHPAEHSFAERAQHFERTIPLGRRLTALTGVVSVVASVAVLVVAIPKGISTASQNNEDIPQTSVPAAKGNVPGLATVEDARARATPAIPLGHNCWLLSADDIDHDSETWMITEDGVRVKVTKVGHVEDSGVVVVKATTITKTNTDDSFDEVAIFGNMVDGAALSDYSVYTVIDASTQKLMSLAPSIVLTNNTRDIPVMTSSPIQSLGAVVDDAERLVGVVIRRGYSTWMLGKDTLQTIREIATGK